MYTLISALSDDRVNDIYPDAREALAEDVAQLPQAAYDWATAQGWGVDQPDELIYIVDGEVDPRGYPTYTVQG